MGGVLQRGWEGGEEFVTDHSRKPDCEDEARTEASSVSSNILETSVDLKSIYKAAFKIL